MNKFEEITDELANFDLESNVCDDPVKQFVANLDLVADTLFPKTKGRFLCQNKCKRVHLRVLVTPQSNGATDTLRGESQIVQCLSSYWGLALQKRQTESLPALEYVRRHSGVWDLSSVPSITIAMTTMFLLRARHTSRGPDGILHLFWYDGGWHAAQSFSIVDLRSKSGFPMPLSCYESSCIFMPKGEEPQNGVDLTPTASNVCPLSFKGNANKVVCGINNFANKSGAADSISQLQQGFVAGRQSGSNIVDVDTAARCFSIAAPIGSL